MPHALAAALSSIKAAATLAALTLAVFAALATAAPAADAAPAITIDTPVAGSTVGVSPAVLNFTITDEPIASHDVQCRADSHAWVSCGNGQPVTGLEQNGAHTLGVRLRDTSVSEPYPVLATDSVSFTLYDVVPPSIVFTDITDGATLTDSDIHAQFSTDDNSAWFTCGIDGGNFMDCQPSDAVPFEYFANGAHTIEIRASDAAGNTNVLTRSFTLADVTAPTVAITAPVDGATAGDSSSPPQITYNSTGDYEAFCRYDDLEPANCNIFNNYTRPRLGNGSHTATVVVRDRAGNAASDTVGFTISDATEPTFTVNHPTEGQNFLDYAQVNLTATDLRARMFVGVDGAGLSEISINSGNPVAWNMPPLSFGAHSVTLIAIDGAGNRSAVTRNFTVGDVTPPTITGFYPADGGSATMGAASVSFTATGISGGVCRIDDLPPFPCQPSTSYDIRDLPAGQHTFYVTASDQAGNLSSGSSTFTVDDSVTGPMTISSPANGATYVAQPVLRLPVNINYGNCRLNGGAWFQCHSGDSILNGLGNGNWSLEVRGFAYPNVFSTVSNFTVNDTTPPELDVVYPRPNDLLGNGAGFMPRWTSRDYNAEGGLGDVSVLCSLDDGPPVDCNVVIDAQSTVTGGAHVLSLMAADWAGNVTVKSVPFTVADTTGPALRITSPNPGATILAGAPHLTFWTDEPVARFTCHVDARPATDCSPTGSWDPQADSGSPLGSGSHTMTVDATDAAGNGSSASVTVTMSDATPPVLTLAETSGDTRSNLASVRWTASEPIAKVRCWIGLTEPVVYTTDPGCTITDDRLAGRYAPSAIAAGARVLMIEVTDAAGNQTVASISITVSDATGPVVTFGDFQHAYGADLFTDAPVGVEFDVDDPSATYQCKIDLPAAWQLCQPPVWIFAAPANGTHTVYITGVDASGNTTTASQAFTVVDVTAPVVALQLNGGTQLRNGMIVPAAFTAEIETEGQPALQCAIDGAALGACAAGTLPVSFSVGGTHTLHVRATDASGNFTDYSVTVMVNPNTLPPLPPPGPPPVPPSLPAVPPSLPAVPPPAAAPSPGAKLRTIKPKVGRSTVGILLRIDLTMPAGVSAVAGCTGSASAQATVARKTVKKGRAALRLISGKCAVVMTLKIKTKLVAGKKTSFLVSFAGNGTIGAFTVKKTLKIKRH